MLTMMAQAVTFDYITGDEGHHVCLRLPKGQPSVKAVLYCHQNMTSEYTFRYDPNYFGFDPKRLWDGITLCIEAEGNGEYKSAVQEINIQINK